MDDHNHHEILQSTYKKYHSTETALIRVQSDILIYLDNRRVVILVLFDLRAAFDTIDHVTLLHQLRHRPGIYHTALEWFKSYLTGRIQPVSIENHYSKPVTLQYGGPQGSVLGPLLYTIYTLLLGDFLRSAGISYHFAADNAQLNRSFDYNDPPSQVECLKVMQRCVSLVKYWMAQNKLKLNDDKTEVIFIPSPSYRKPPTLEKFSVDCTAIQNATAVRNIREMFDDAMTTSEQVTAICREAHFHLRNVGRIRKCIAYEACEKFIHALVTSRFDSWNSVLHDLPASHAIKQTIEDDPQSCAYSASHIKTLNGLAPQYLSSLLQPYSIEAFAFRSYYKKLAQPKARTKTYCERAFAYAASTLWNRLPGEIRSIITLNSFKISIKDFLFKSFNLQYLLTSMAKLSMILSVIGYSISLAL